MFNAVSATEAIFTANPDKNTATYYYKFMSGYDVMGMML